MIADRHPGYRGGGTSPSSTRRAMPVSRGRTSAPLPRVFIDDGSLRRIVSIVAAEALARPFPTLVSMTP